MSALARASTSTNNDTGSARSARSNTGISVRVPDFQAPVWDRPVPCTGPRPAVWLLGAHGGAGVATLAQVLAPAGNCARRWPGCFGDESPFVIVVARETIRGLVNAQDLLRAHSAGLAGRSRLVGLITVADRPGRKVPTPIRHTIEVTAGLVDSHWRVGWIEQYPLTRDLDTLPAWSPHDPPPVDKKTVSGVPLEIAELGSEIRNALVAAMNPAH